jgi:WD40 repeat protein
MPGPPLKRVEELFHQAAALPPDLRPGFLGEACGGDDALREAVETLLRHDGDATDLLGAGPLAREADQVRQLDPTRPMPGGAALPPTALPQIPDYEVRRVLGRGGMGVVYLAFHVPLKRLVALKTLPDTPVTPGHLARFRTEAEALARLQHPNVVPIYEVGEWQGHPYFTMEYVAGPALADLLDGRPQDSDDAAALVEVLARAVHADHQCGIVHRDINPANVLLASGGRQPPDTRSGSLRPPLAEYTPKLTDFGVAKDLASSSRLTLTGTAVGTPSYMAPEQVRGGTVGPAADVYALGSVLYELLTGRPPFDAPTAVEVIAQLTHEEPLAPSRLRPRLPRDLETICLKCLEKSPRRRYASTLDLADDLRRFRAREPIRARPVGPLGRIYRWCVRRPLVAGLIALSAGLALALVVTLVVFDARLSEKAAEEQRQLVRINVTVGALEMEDGDCFAAVLRFSEALRLDPDEAHGPAHRTRIATALRQGPGLLRVRAHDGRVLCARLGPSEWRVVSTGAGGTVEVWDALTGDLIGEPLMAGDEPADAALSADGRLVAVASPGGEVRVWQVAAGRPRVLRANGGRRVVGMAFGPDGRSLLLRHADGSARLWDLTGEPALLPVTWGDASVAAVSDGGRWLLTVSTDHSARVWDLDNRTADGPPLALDGAVSRAAISADGRRLALVGEGGDLRVRDLAGARWFRAPASPGRDVSHVAFSPDGEQVVTAAGGPSVRLWRPTTGEVLDMGSRGAVFADAQFSPDGRLVVAGGGSEVRVWDAATGRPLTPPLRHGAPFAGAASGADGGRLVTLTRGGTVCVWGLPHPPEPADDPSPEELAADRGPGLVTLGKRTTIRVRHWALSQDGRRLIAAGEDGSVRVWDILADEPLAPPCQPGRTVRAVCFRAGGDRAVVAEEGGPTLTWDLSPDGRPVGELLALARLLASAEINGDQKREALDERAFRDAWAALHPAE